MPDEAVLVHIADLAADGLRQRRRDGHEIAHTIEAAGPLEARRIEVDERLATEVERRPAVQRKRIFEVGADPPAGAVQAMAPTLLEPQSTAELTRSEAREIV